MAGVGDIDRKLLSFEELGLGFGQEMFIIPNPADKDAIFSCELIGCLKEQSIVIGPPASTGILPQFIEGQRSIAQVKLAGGIALFPTTVLFISEIPSQMVYLDYPKDVKFKQVRGAMRVDIALPVLVFNKNRGEDCQAVVGKIVDISTTGAGLEMFEELGEVGDRVQIKGKFQVGAIQRVLSIDAKVRARSTKDGRYFYGIEFNEGDEEKLLVLMGFTFHAMAFGHLQPIR